MSNSNQQIEKFVYSMLSSLTYYTTFFSAHTSPTRYQLKSNKKYLYSLGSRNPYLHCHLELQLLTKEKSNWTHVGNEYLTNEKRFNIASWNISLDRHARFAAEYKTIKSFIYYCLFLLTNYVFLVVLEGSWIFFFCIFFCCLLLLMTFFS